MPRALRGKRGPLERETPLRALRLSLGLNQEHMALLAGVPRAAVCRLEWQKDLAKLRLGDLIRLAGTLGVAPVELLPGLRARPGKPELTGSALRLARRLAQEYRGPLRPDALGAGDRLRPDRLKPPDPPAEPEVPEPNSA